jgi:hypothetical protein
MDINYTQTELLMYKSHRKMQLVHCHFLMKKNYKFNLRFSQWNTNNQTRYKPSDITAGCYQIIKVAWED